MGPAWGAGPLGAVSGGGATPTPTPAGKAASQPRLKGGEGAFSAGVGVCVAPPAEAAPNGSVSQAGPIAGLGNPGTGHVDLAAILQKLAAGQQLTDNRLTALEHKPGPQHPQQHPQPRQPQHPPRGVGQPGGGELVEGQAQLGGVRAVGAPRQHAYGASRLVQAMSAWLVKTRRAPSWHSRDARVYGHTTTVMHKLSTTPPPPPADHVHLDHAHLDPAHVNKVTAAAKANAKQAADMWRSTGGQRYLMGRGRIHVSEDTLGGMLRMTLKHAAAVADAVVQQFATLEGFDVQSFCPPPPSRAPPVATPADVHFRTLIAAYDAVLNYGMESAPSGVQEQGRRPDVGADGRPERRADLAPYSWQERDLLIPDMDFGLDEAM